MNRSKLQYLSGEFNHIYGIKSNEYFLRSITSGQSFMYISFEAEELYKCFEYFECTQLEFSNLLRVSEQKFSDLLKCEDHLPDYISIRLGHLTVLLILGYDKVGGKNNFLKWLHEHNSRLDLTSSLSNDVRNYYNQLITLLYPDLIDL